MTRDATFQMLMDDRDEWRERAIRDREGMNRNAMIAQRYGRILRRIRDNPDSNSADELSGMADMAIRYPESG